MASTTSTQASRVIARFGGYRKLARLLGKHHITIRRWEYPKAQGGSDGLIPGDALQDIIELGDLHGVLLTSADLDPRPR